MSIYSVEGGDPDVTDHDTGGLDCWCSPTYMVPCDECEDGCWKCTVGTNTLTRAEADACESCIIVVHNA